MCSNVFLGILLMVIKFLLKSEIAESDENGMRGSQLRSVIKTTLILDASSWKRCGSRQRQREKKKKKKKMDEIASKEKHGADGERQASRANGWVRMAEGGGGGCVAPSNKVQRSEKNIFTECAVESTCHKLLLSYRLN